jgi:hypothetical protein
VSGALDLTVSDHVGTDALAAVLLADKARFRRDPADQGP